MSILYPTSDVDLGPELVKMPSGLLVPSGVAQEVAERRRRRTCVDVFAGCGGFSLGMIQAGMEVVGAIEMWTEAVLTYMCNLCRYGQVQMHFVTDEDEDRMERHLRKMFFKKSKEVQGELFTAGSGWISTEPEDTPGVSHMIVGDVRKISGAWLLKILGLERGELGCMVGGPPCQGFSTSGKRNTMDPRNSLVFEYARLIIETMPQTMIMENVPGILTMVTPKGQPVVERFCQILRDGGFHGVEAFEQACERYGRVGVMNAKKVRRSSKKAAKESEEMEEPEEQANAS